MRGHTTTRDVTFGSPLIQGNTITYKSRTSCSGRIGGGGIAVNGPGAVQILNSVFSRNPLFGANAGGISLIGAGAPISVATS
jgi:hypothetical protein